MENKKFEILSGLLSDIDSKTFELEAWKQKTILVFKKVFGADDEKISLIENLHYDFSSWALRDSSGGKSNDKTKETARKIIEAAQSELLLQQQDNLVVAVLKEELTGRDFTALMAATEGNDDAAASVNAFFSKITSVEKDRLLTRLVMKSLGR